MFLDRLLSGRDRRIEYRGHLSSYDKPSCQPIRNPSYRLFMVNASATFESVADDGLSLLSPFKVDATNGFSPFIAKFARTVLVRID
jgi:hypothetical protein